MNENLLSYFWKSRCFPQQGLRTTRGEEIAIISPGIQNPNQGPDFLMAKIRMGEVLWAGQVEIHVRSSDWIRHGHQSDPNYRNVVLHVVWEDDLRGESGMPDVPTLQLRDYIASDQIERYKDLTGAQSRISCLPMLSTVESLHLSSQIESVSVERLEEKSKKMESGLRHWDGDWDALMYSELCRYLNSPVNAHAAEELTRRLPWTCILKTRDDAVKLEALVLTCAGLLSEKHEDPWLRSMYREGEFLLRKFGLSPMGETDWHYLRMRPAHFPGLRLAQLCALFHALERPFHAILDCTDLDRARALFRVSPSRYWDSHYRPGGRNHAPTTKRLGSSTLDLIWINVICPMMHLYGIRQGRPGYCDRALQWLEKLPPEDNKWTRIWKQTGMAAENARQSQGVLLQIRDYCDQKKCLHCRIGHRILSTSRGLRQTYP